MHRLIFRKKNENCTLTDVKTVPLKKLHLPQITRHELKRIITGLEPLSPTSKSYLLEVLNDIEIASVISRYVPVSNNKTYGIPGTIRVQVSYDVISSDFIKFEISVSEYQSKNHVTIKVEAFVDEFSTRMECHQSVLRFLEEKQLKLFFSKFAYVKVYVLTGEREIQEIIYYIPSVNG